MPENINANELLKRDHKEFESTYARYIKAEGEAKKELAKKLLTDLTVHTEIEEEFYYPELENAGEDELVAEFKAEHQEAKLLIAKLTLLNIEDPSYDGNMTALMETVKQHASEEESEAMIEIEEILGKPRLMEIGEMMSERKEELYDSVLKRLWASIT